MTQLVSKILVYLFLHSQFLSSVLGDIRFYYFPHKDKTSRQKIRLDNLNGLEFRNGPFYIVIDGFLSNIEASMLQEVKNSLISTRPNGNVILVDWGDLSGSRMLKNQEKISTSQLWMTYNLAKSQVDLVGLKVAEFLRNLVVNGFTDLSRVHVIGFSLGAHIAGVAGYNIIQKYKDRITRITGLDPAGLGFPMKKRDKRLDKSDAEFVDVYYTNKYVAGDFEKDVGHVDVYINGGNSQPGCDFPSIINSTICSHSFSWKAWNRCMSSKCEACFCSKPQCENIQKDSCVKSVLVGMELSMDITGEYYLTMGQLD